MPVLTRSASGRLTRFLVDALTWPHGADRYLEHLSPLLAWDDVRAEVVAVDRSVPGAAVLSLRPTATWGGARAGQWVRLAVELDGRRRTRCFSVASGEHRPDGLLLLGVRRHPRRHRLPPPGGAHRPGRRADDLAGAGGPRPPRRPRSDGRRLLTVSGGSGVTPVLSLLATLAAERAGAGGSRPRRRPALRADRGPADRRGPMLADAAQRAGLAAPRVLATRGSGAGSGRFSAELVADVDPGRDARLRLRAAVAGRRGAGSGGRRPGATPSTSSPSTTRPASRPGRPAGAGHHRWAGSPSRPAGPGGGRRRPPAAGAGGVRRPHPRLRLPPGHLPHLRAPPGGRRRPRPRHRRRHLRARVVRRPVHVRPGRRRRRRRLSPPPPAPDPTVDPEETDHEQHPHPS